MGGYSLQHPLGKKRVLLMQITVVLFNINLGLEDSFVPAGTFLKLTATRSLQSM